MSGVPCAGAGIAFRFVGERFRFPNDPEGAERVYRQALALDSGNEPDAVTVTFLHNLATVQPDQGRTADCGKALPGRSDPTAPPVPARARGHRGNNRRTQASSAIPQKAQPFTVGRQSCCLPIFSCLVASAAKLLGI